MNPLARTRLSKDRIDQLMYMSPKANRAWQPTNPEDLRYGWDQKYLTKYGQPFTAFYFARNASAVLGAAQAGFDRALLSDMGTYLDSIAARYIKSLDGHLVVVNEFDYENIWTRFLSGFYGAFQNSVTALGYIHLHEALGNVTYLQRAQALLRAVLRWKRTPLSGLDSDGQFWLFEYVFRAPEEDQPYLERVGFVKGMDNHFRASVFNGHMHALFSFVRYEASTDSSEFSEAIEAACATMKATLPGQIYADRYFSYMKQFPAVPDYGQERAVFLARGIAEMYPEDSDFAQTVARMEDFFHRVLSGREREIVDAGMEYARKVHLSLRSP